MKSTFIKNFGIILIISIVGIIALDMWTKSNGSANVERRKPYQDNLRSLPVNDKNPSSKNGHRVEKWMSDWDGSIFDFEYKVKQQLHDPSSFEHVETSYSEQGLEAQVRMKFRAKNKFGAKVLNQADGILDVTDGSVSNITINY